MLLKSPFEKGGFKNLQTEGIYGKRYKCLGRPFSEPENTCLRAT
jgi:hypothetical protein